MFVEKPFLFCVDFFTKVWLLHSVIQSYIHYYVYMTVYIPQLV